MPEERILERLQLKSVSSFRKYRGGYFADRAGRRVTLTAWCTFQWPLSPRLQ